MNRREFGLLVSYSLMMATPFKARAAIETKEARLDLSKLFPYIVPDIWVRTVGRDALISRKLALDLNAVLVQDLNGIVRNVSITESERSGRSNEALFEVAKSNVLQAWRDEHFSAGFGVNVDGVKFGGAEGSWLAPSIVLSRDFLQHATMHLDTHNILVAIPNQERLVAFPNTKAAASSKKLASLVRDGFSNHLKPVTNQVFKLSRRGRLEPAAFEWLV